MSFSRSLRFLYTERSRLPLWGILFLMILLGCWLVWFSRVKVPLYAVTDSARLEVDQASYPLQSSIEGRIDKIYRKLGQEVKAGTLLIKLDDQSYQLKRKEAQSRYDSFSAQLSALKTQISQEEALLEEEEKITLIKLQEARSRYQEETIAADFSQEEAERFNNLYKQGVLSQMKSLRAQSEAEKKKTSAKTLLISLDRLKGEHLVKKKEGQTRLSQLRQELLQIQGEINKNLAVMEQLDCEIEKHKIKAPVSGKIAELADLHTGMFIREGDTLGSILPEGNLKAVAFFPPSEAMGKISPGQKAYLRLKGFSWLQYRSIPAEVEKVSQEARYGQIRVDLKPDGCRSSIALQHGLPARVEIEIERITPAVLVLRKAGKLLALDPHPTGRGRPQTLETVEAGGLR